MRRRKAVKRMNSVQAAKVTANAARALGKLYKMLQPVRRNLASMDPHFTVSEREFDLAMTDIAKASGVFDEITQELHSLE